MKKFDETMLPDVPEVFSRAMHTTLGAICAQERENEARKQRGVPRVKRRVLATLIAAMVVLASIAVAMVMRYRVFDVLMGGTPEAAGTFMQEDLAGVTVGDVTLTMREAGYDGVTLYLCYSVVDKNVKTTYGKKDPETGIAYIEDNEALPTLGQMWADDFWIDGKSIGMPDMSSGLVSGSDIPGEVLYYNAYRLDQVGVRLSGEVRITLPILQRPERASDYYNRETQTMTEPDEGVFTFLLDCTAAEKYTQTRRTQVHTQVDGIDLWTQQAIFSPLYTYVTLNYEIPQAAIDAYIAENGEGFTDEEGNVLFPYSGMDVITPYLLSDLTLVDALGRPLYEHQGDGMFIYGNSGYGDTQATFLYPAMQTLDEEIYIAPLCGERADMTRAVRVN